MKHRLVHCEPGRHRRTVRDPGRPTRRDFLTLIGVATAARALPSTAGSARPRHADMPPWQMRLSTSSIHFMELPIEQACKRIAELGFEDPEGATPNAAHNGMNIWNHVLAISLSVQVIRLRFWHCNGRTVLASRSATGGTADSSMFCA